MLIDYNIVSFFSLVWEKQELIDTFLPIFEKVRDQTPESQPFLQPVNMERIPVSIVNILMLKESCVKLIKLCF